MIKRIATAAVVLPLLFLYIMKLPTVYYIVLIAAASLLAQAEFYKMYRTGRALAIVGVVLGTAVISASAASYALFHDAMVVSLIVMLSLRMLIKGPTGSMSELAPALIGVFYIAGLFGYHARLRTIGPEWVVFLYGTVWASDGLAYFVGKGIGKIKLYPAMSPNKTVEGAIGSVAGGIIGAYILKYGIIPDIALQRPAIVGASIGLITIVGDLVESMFKRDAGVKDSGGIIPGHGGMLDKIDGGLVAAPLLFWMITAHLV